MNCAAVRDDTNNWTLDFEVSDPSDVLRLPQAAAPYRTDGLWRSTCFELFLRQKDREEYFEFNFSPSTQWAAYSFERYRQDGADLEIKRLEIEAPARIGSAWNLRVALDGSAFGGEDPWLAGLSAVIVEQNGAKSYWALHHPSDKPDFHHPDSFVLELP